MKQKKKNENAGEELPRPLDDEGIVAVSLGVEADDVVAALQASDRTTFVEAKI